MVTEVTFSLDSIDETVKKWLLPRVSAGAMFFVSGPLGAGKTTVAKALARQLGIKDQVISPTFTYVSIYDLSEPAGAVRRLVHFDLYRLSSFDELVNLDLLECLMDRESVCFVEWPEILRDKLRVLGGERPVFELKLDHCDGGDQARKMIISEADIK